MKEENFNGRGGTRLKPSGSHLFHEKVGPKDKTLKLYEGHFHDLLNDVGKEKVMGDVVGWINARVA